MKTLFRILLCMAAISWSSPGFTQDKKDTIKVNPDPKIKKAAKKVGNKTAEIAIKGASKVADKTYKDKVGPMGKPFTSIATPGTIM